ncbi:serine/threonine-protein kinase [Streptomyces sp. NPDC051956]|uniref:serine/threonine-protein kinase n=1 Tax=Streptomyces sp. NPDC051956 TaxID=3365677 RepID=UPI0037D24394
MRDQLLGGRYRLVRQVGEGGMGQVWEAQDETLGRPVAIKVISLLAGGGSLGGEARARFLREARITAQLQHPNIVTIHDLGESGAGNERVPFLVMELVRGEGLDAMLRRGVVTLPDAARWGAQIGDALTDAHNAGIMHRDIKPSNILITQSGNVKVLDFGIARAADPYATADRLTQTGFIVGTPPYMAPEQARGFPEPRSDLYALGCLLFELITGQLPFQAPDTVGYLTAHLTQEPPAPSSVSTDIPPAWDRLVLTLLHKDPDQRYPNATELSQALRQLDRVQEPESPAGHEARNILLARMARAMSTSLARRAALSQDADGNGAVQTTQSQVKTTVQMPPTAPLASFDMSWTGQDPLFTYAARPRVVATWFTALLSSAIAVASIYFPLHLGLVTPGATDGQDGWLAVMSVGGALGGLVALGATAGAITGTFVISKHARARKAISQWALHVDPRGIATGSAAGRREVPWDQIQRVSIEEIQGPLPYRYTGIHVDLEHGASRPTMLRPAGWPYSQPDTVKDRSRVPVCVLGPMTERQRTELIEALAGYGGRRWVPSVHFTTLPVDL